MALARLYKSVLSHFPQKGLQYAFAYGSGVFRQVGHKDMSKNMLDFIFVVDNPEHWHKENLQHNKKHYSWLRFFGAENIGRIQDDFGAKIYFNPFVSCEGRNIKYGVISTKSLIEDLTDWKTLYVSGRLHKPVYNVIEPNGKYLKNALSQNRRSAAHTALLLLSDQFTEEEFYLTIAGLSYTGDFRMTVGEDKKKVSNIVKPNIDEFREIYTDFLDNDEFTYWNKEEGVMEQSLCGSSRYYHMLNLPLNVQHRLTAMRNMDGRHRDTEEVLRSYARGMIMEYDEMLKKAITSIVNASSKTQSLKGILTAGLYKSLKYSGKKLVKSYKSQK